MVWVSLRAFLFCLLAGTFAVAGAQSASGPPLKELPLSPTPIMGWSSWNHYGTTITEAEVKANADALVSSGLRDLGYKFVNLDGSWEGQRDANGVLHPNPQKFGDMKELGDYLHARDLKYGLYSSPGPLSCGGFIASYQHEDQDAKMFADWGVDYLKYDLCSFRIYMKLAAQKGGHAASTQAQIAAYERMHQALLKAGRPIYYALCQYGLDYVWEWGPKVGATMYRTTGDIKDNWISMTGIGFAQAGLAKYVNVGHYIDPDSLEIGNGGMSPEEYRVEMSMWSMLAAPLILGNDLTKLDAQTLSIIGNKEVIAIDQDPLVKVGDRVWAVGQLEFWARPLKDGAEAVALFNRNQGITTMTFHLSDIGWSGPVSARDVWTHRNLPTITDTFTADVPKHGVVMLVLHKKK
jgi:alpha-galactosidase